VEGWVGDNGRERKKYNKKEGNKDRKRTKKRRGKWEGNKFPIFP
jgi:hypothetical protein